MATPVNIQIDARNFTSALQDYAATTKKDRDLIVNTAAKHLAYQAVEKTRFADVNAIRALKEVSSVDITRQTKTGKVKFLKDFNSLTAKSKERRTNYQATPRAFKIYLAYLYRHGKNPRSFSNRAALMEKALRMVNAKISSVNYLRSGWLTAANYFNDIIKGTGGLRKPQMNRKKLGTGGATISTGGRATAWIWNSSLYSRETHAIAPGLVRYATEGLQKALAVSQSKLEQITKERLARAAKRFS